VYGDEHIWDFHISALSLSKIHLNPLQVQRRCCCSYWECDNDDGDYVKQF